MSAHINFYLSIFFFLILLLLFLLSTRDELVYKAEGDLATLAGINEQSSYLTLA